MFIDVYCICSESNLSFLISCISLNLLNNFLCRFWTWMFVYKSHEKDADHPVLQ